MLSHLPNVAYRHKSSAYLQAAITASREVDAIFVDFIGLFGLVARCARRWAKMAR
uniref:Uncharacterized protein n=1 Tax=Phenylobacterium glaciei TaxID=2803784 RepID=A0A974P6M3_9CAUL|nr:hypothetical protein JKL49_11520 [Phenylobacterium glaciei]